MDSPVFIVFFFVFFFIMSELDCELVVFSRALLFSPGSEIVFVMEMGEIITAPPKFTIPPETVPIDIFFRPFKTKFPHAFFISYEIIWTMYIHLPNAIKKVTDLSHFSLLFLPLKKIIFQKSFELSFGWYFYFKIVNFFKINCNLLSS